jgi:hypothetical protein
MGTPYKTNVQEIGAATFKDADRAATLALDVVDAAVDSRALEGVEDAVAEQVEPFVAQVLGRMQEEMGEWAGFVGSVFDDADAAVDFLLAKVDAWKDLGTFEAPADAVAMVARPFLADYLRTLQAKAAAAEIDAED